MRVDRRTVCGRGVWVVLVEGVGSGWWGRRRIGHEGRDDVGDKTGIVGSVDGSDAEEPAQDGEGQFGEARLRGAKRRVARQRGLGLLGAR